MNALINDLGQALLVFTFCLPRLIAAFMIMPVFSKQVLPGLIRNGVAGSLALFIFPLAIANAPTEPLSLISGFIILTKEMVIGMLIGYAAAAPFWAIESAGFFIDNQRGATMASSIDPLTGSQTSPLGIFLVQALTVVFFVSGGFLLFLGALYNSYQLWPVFSFFPVLNWDAIPYFLGILDRLMGLAVLLAAPMIITMFMAEYSLGLISRFAPQLNVFFLAMPVKSAVGIFLLVLAIGLILSYFSDELRKLPLQFIALDQLFR
ncbi:MAG: type III secretion system export apparatus subunit SctT [Candidatus Competibacteraceae bacterium]|nr:type III secretion system export apparatus subunit SctT [Candidatus Competibacteraceae bacterium]